MPDPKQSAPVSSAAGRSEAMAWIVAVAAWLVPGLGHALQRKWARAVVYFVTVAALVIVGITMHGTLFTSEGAADAFGFLGKRKLPDRVKYAVWAFFMFMLIGVAIGWAMYPFSR